MTGKGQDVSLTGGNGLRIGGLVRAAEEGVVAVA